MKNVLIVGGTSGLGREMALKFFEEGHLVTVVGRGMLHNGPFNLDSIPKQKEIIRVVGGFDLVGNSDRIKDIILDFDYRNSRIDIFVYVAGFYQEKSFGELVGYDIDEMLAVGLRAPAFFLRHIFAFQENLSGFIAITSTSQWTPRAKEPMYTAVKSGLYMMASSVSLDERVGKVLVAAPAGMKTNFFKGKKTEEEMKDYLDSKWVADQIVRLYNNSLDPDGANYEFRFAKILRNPPRVEIAETRYKNK